MIEQAAQSSLPEVERSRALSRAAELLQLIENSEALLGRYISPEEHAASAVTIDRGAKQIVGAGTATATEPTREDAASAARADKLNPDVDLSQEISTPRDSPNSQPNTPA